MTQAFPLQWPDGWPRAKSRKSAKFGTSERKYTDGGSYSKRTDLTMAEAMKRVHYELERLGVNILDDSVVSTNLQLNMSGLPRGNQGEPSDPGAAVYFKKRNQPMRVLAIDAYARVRDNLAAIAATLEAMRAIERHGGAQILERAFTGFAALSGPSPKHWRETLALPRDNTPVTPDMVASAYRILAAVRHPDQGGSHDAMAELNAARQAALKEIDS